ncbi:MAG TPA: hypothetical protein VHG69_06710, partial [Thermoleophilaceae bacterium]|nr:hypothetical protein [Thermoleophilaceae bacterium]
RSILGAEFFEDLASRLGRDPKLLTEIITAPRTWYAERFAAGEQTVTRAAWERTPFEIRPVLQLADGRFVVISPRAISGWIGEGFYHRALASARRSGLANRLQRFYGVLVEHYALHTLRQAHPEPRLPGSGRVAGEQSYGRGGGKKSPDMSVDCGPDLVLIEVASGRFALPTLIEGDPEKAAADLSRLLFRKLDQLGRRIDDLLAGEWSPPDVAIESVKRIWPVVVTADMLQNDLLWEEINRRIPEGLKRARVQRLTLLDLPDLELLAGLIERGFALQDILRRKATGPYVEMDLRRFVFDTPGIPHKVRPSAIENRWSEEMVKVAQLFGYDLDKEGARRRAEEGSA